VTETRLFVYGSLMAGLRFADLLDGATFAGPATTRETYTLIDLGPYPAASPSGPSVLQGEVYVVDPPTLARVDRLEGHPDLYERHQRPLSDGTSAWLYEARIERWEPGSLDDRPAVPNGDWRQWLGQRQAT
jgi:gamma-glutamylaminecyclotransferase